MKVHIKRLIALTVFILILTLTSQSYAGKVCNIDTLSFYDHTERSFNLKTINENNEQATTYNDIGYNIIITHDKNFLENFRNIPANTECYSTAISIDDISSGSTDPTPYEYKDIALKISPEPTPNNKFININLTLYNKTNKDMNDVSLAIAADVSGSSNDSAILLNVLNDNSILRQDPSTGQSTYFTLRNSSYITPVSSIWIGPFTTPLNKHYLNYLNSDYKSDDIKENDNGEYNNGCIIFSWKDVSIPANGEVTKNFLVSNKVTSTSVLSLDRTDFKISQKTNISGTIHDQNALNGSEFLYSLDNETPVPVNATIDRETGRFSFEIPNLQLKNYSLKLYISDKGSIYSACNPVTLSPCKVTYRLPDGTIIKEDYVFKNGTSVPPTNISELGNEFTSWDKPNTNIQEDTVITAILNTAFDGTVSDSTGGTNILIQYVTANEYSGLTCKAAPLRKEDLTPTQLSQVQHLSKYRCYNIELQYLDSTYDPHSLIRVGIPIPPEFQNTNLVVYGLTDTRSRSEYAVTVVNNYAYFQTTSLGNFALTDLAPDQPSTETDSPTIEEPKDGVINSVISGPVTGDSIALFVCLFVACILFFAYKNKEKLKLVTSKIKTINKFNFIKKASAKTNTDLPSMIINEKKRKLNDIESKYKDLL